MYRTVINYTPIANAKWILSGTPIQNRKSDIVNILSFIGIPVPKIKRDIELYISKYLLRRTKKVLMDGTFDEVDFNTHIIPFKTREEQHIYSQIETVSLEELADLKYSGVSPLNYEMMLLEIMIRLRQASSHPQIAIDSMIRKYDEVNFPEFKTLSTKIEAIIHDLQDATGL